MTKEELEIAKAAYCVGKIWDIYEGKENFDHMVGLRVKHLIELVRNYQQPSILTIKGWISVDEKLPEMDEEVIVLTDELGTAPIYKIAFGHIVNVERCIDYDGWNIPGVKYWMACPKIPNND